MGLNIAGTSIDNLTEGCGLRDLSCEMALPVLPLILFTSAVFAPCVRQGIDLYVIIVNVNLICSLPSIGSANDAPASTSLVVCPADFLQCLLSMYLQSDVYPPHWTTVL